MPEITDHLHPPEQGQSGFKRILCIPDGPNWIFNRHVQAFKRHLGDEFEFSTVFRGEEYDEDAYDLIYPLEFNMVTPEQIRSSAKYVTGVRSFVSWVDWEFLDLVNMLSQRYQQVHTVSRQLYEILSPYIPQLVYITHGVDIHHYMPRAKRQTQTGRLRLGWAGNRFTAVKGFRDFIQPLGELPGIELVFCGFADRNYTFDEMPGFYESIDAYVNASSFEGNNNSLLEAAAMECAILTTSNGTVPEYLTNEQSALIVNRDLEQFKQAAIRLRDDPELRIRLGAQARQAILEGGWDWQSRAEDYRRFFRSALKHTSEDLHKPVKAEIIDYQHYASVLRLQYILERELRINVAVKNIDLETQIKSMQQILELTQKNLDGILSSENYLLAASIQNTPAGQNLLRLYRQIRHIRKGLDKK